jgi:arylsulfatase A-like enzyme
LAGFIDLGLMVLQKRVVQGDFIRLGEDYVWLIPLGVTILVLVPAIVLVSFAWVRRGRVRFGVAVGILAFVGFLDASARLPLALWGALFLCAGLATQSARLAGRRPAAFLQFVRRTVPLLAVALLALMLVMRGGRAWSEHRAVTDLPPAPSGARNVLLVVWDTVRFGNLSLNGYVRPTTPNLEQLAARGTRFNLAFSSSSWTLPAHASLFTGHWPHEVGVDWQSPLRDDVPTLAVYLTSRGYDTAGFAANFEYCSRETGLARGFAHFEDYPIDLYNTLAQYTALGHRLEVSDWACALGQLLERYTGRTFDVVPRSFPHVKNAAEVGEALLDWLTRRAGRRRPFFAFLNLNDAHSPYEVPDRSIPGFGVRPATTWDRLTLLRWHALEKANLTTHDVQMAADVYDDCILYLDRRLGMLLEELKRRGVLDDTLVIFTSDHGEHLGDHLLFFHGCSLYRQLVQVPLVIVDPKRVPAGHVVAEPVSLRDIPATIVDLLGLGQDAPFPGRSLARCWGRADHAPRSAGEPLLMETGQPLLLTNQGREPAAGGPMKSLIALGMHYISVADGREELYGLKSDPDERFNVAGTDDAQPALRRFRNALGSLFRLNAPRPRLGRVAHFGH